MVSRQRLCNAALRFWTFAGCLDILHDDGLADSRYTAVRLVSVFLQASSCQVKRFPRRCLLLLSLHVWTTVLVHHRHGVILVLPRFSALTLPCALPLNRCGFFSSQISSSSPLYFHIAPPRLCLQRNALPWCSSHTDSFSPSSVSTTARCQHLSQITIFWPWLLPPRFLAIIRFGEADRVVSTISAISRRSNFAIVGVMESSCRTSSPCCHRASPSAWSCTKLPLVLAIELLWNLASVVQHRIFRAFHLSSNRHSLENKPKLRHHGLCRFLANAGGVFMEICELMLGPCLTESSDGTSSDSATVLGGFALTHIRIGLFSIPRIRLCILVHLLVVRALCVSLLCFISFQEKTITDFAAPRLVSISISKLQTWHSDRQQTSVFSRSAAQQLMSNMPLTLELQPKSTDACVWFSRALHSRSYSSSSKFESFWVKK